MIRIQRECWYRQGRKTKCRLQGTAKEGLCPSHAAMYERELRRLKRLVEKENMKDMGHRMKYIVLKVSRGGLDYEYPIIFPQSLTHALMAESLKKEEELKGAEVISAGEFNSMDCAVDCYGKSISLGNIKSRGEVDSNLIMWHDYFHGIVS